MRFEEYAAIPALNWSLLRNMATSPRHFRHAQQAERPDTPAMRLGRAVHCAVLEPDALPERYVVWNGPRRGNSWLRFDAETEDAGLEVLTGDEYRRCLAVRDAVREHPVAGDLFTGGSAEKVVTWVDVETDIPCKARLDYVKREQLVDLKTTRDISEWAFGRTVAQYHYHGQFAFYLAGMKAQYSLTVPYPAPIIVAVESDAPHDVAVYRLDDDTLWAGEELARGLLAKVKSCTDSGDWPGQYPTEHELTLPPWAFPDDGTARLEGLR